MLPPVGRKTAVGDPCCSLGDSCDGALLCDGENGGEGPGLGTTNDGDAGNCPGTAANWGGARCEDCRSYVTAHW